MKGRNGMAIQEEILQLAFDAKLRQWAEIHKKISKKILKGYSANEYEWKRAAKATRELEQIALMGDITKEQIDAIKSQDERTVYNGKTTENNDNGRTSSGITGGF